jgi:hypothetical protein
MVRKLLSTLLIGGLVGVFATVSPAGASPDHWSPTPKSGTVDGQPFTAPDKSALGHGGSASPALAPGCYGQTDQPHSSSHVNGSINVVARTVCSGLGVHVDVTLYRSRWYGWQQRGYGSKNGTNSVSTNAAESAADCSGTHDYLANSYHEASDSSYAYTSNRANGLTC